MIRRPDFSIMALIAPVRLRAVASGLRIEKVRSIAIKFSSESRHGGKCAAYSGEGRAEQASAAPIANAGADLALKLMQEVDHCAADLGGALLLGPVAATGKHDRAAQLRHVGRQIGNHLIHVA